MIMKAGYYDNASRGGCVDYMSYNARLASMLYQMTVNIGRGTTVMRSELRDSWVYLSRFSGPGAVDSPAPNDAHPLGPAALADPVRGPHLRRAAVPG